MRPLRCLTCCFGSLAVLLALLALAVFAGVPLALDIVRRIAT